jgi:hypothetical protein
MIARMSLCISLLAVVLLASGAFGQGDRTEAPKEKVKPVDRNTPAQEQPKPLKLSGIRSAIRKERFAILRNPQALDELLREHNPHAQMNLEPIDWEKYTVVAYFAGIKPTGGFTVELIGVDRKKESAVVKVRLMTPGKGSIVTQMLTQPFVIQAVEKLPAKVTHTVTEQERAPK